MQNDGVPVSFSSLKLNGNVNMYLEASSTVRDLPMPELCTIDVKFEVPGVDRGLSLFIEFRHSSRSMWLFPSKSTFQSSRVAIGADEISGELQWGHSYLSLW